MIDTCLSRTQVTLINELVRRYHAKLANLCFATATQPELQQRLTDDCAYRLSIDLEDALDDAYAARDIDSARQIDSVIRQFYIGHLSKLQALQAAA